MAALVSSVMVTMQFSSSRLKHIANLSKTHQTQAFTSMHIYRVYTKTYCSGSSSSYKINLIIVMRGKME